VTRWFQVAVLADFERATTVGAGAAVSGAVRGPEAQAHAAEQSM